MAKIYLKSVCMTVIAGILAMTLSSCATPDQKIAQLTAESVAIFDSLPTKDKKYLEFRKVGRSDVTQGVISDYVRVIEYLADRADLQENSFISTPIFPRHEPYQQVVLFYKGWSKIDDAHSKLHRSERCVIDCKKILFGGHAERSFAPK